MLLILFWIGWAAGCSLTASAVAKVAATPAAHMACRTGGINALADPADVPMTLSRTSTGTLFSESPSLTAVNQTAATRRLTLKWANTNSFYYVSVRTPSINERLENSGTLEVNEGDEVSIYCSMNVGYVCSGFTLNGKEQTFSGNSFSFVMPASDAVLVISTVYNPSSPADPEAPDLTKKYTLNVVSNPVGASDIEKPQKYAAGKKLNLYAYPRSGYVFKCWTHNGDTLSTSYNLSYTMPEADVTLTKHFVYNPTSPGDPEQPKLTHPLTATAIPAGAATFWVSSSEVPFGETYIVEAYPRNGYKLKGWTVNGVPHKSVSNQLTDTMTVAGAQVVALLDYDPMSPTEPNLNHYDATTGRMIVDHFEPGDLRSAINKLMNGSSYDGITSLIVKGQTTSYDVSQIANMKMLQSLDLSRTAGCTAIPYNAFANLPATSIVLPADVASLNNNVFSGCANLMSLSLHSTVPPTVSSNTFANFTPSNCVLRVPEEAIELYKADANWNKFADIVPLGEAVHVLEVQLPTAYRDGRLKNNRIEIVNAATGLRQRYVITDRPIYTFNGVQKDDVYLVLLLSENGLVMSRIENVVIPDADHAVAFTNIKEMVEVSAKVLSPTGEDLTANSTLEWFQINDENEPVFLGKTNALKNVPTGERLLVKTTLSREQAMQFVQPDEFNCEVTAGMQPLSIQLKNLRALSLLGKIVDENGLPMNGATATLTQRVAGKYDRSFIARTDAKGEWTAVAIEAPFTSITYSANECVAKTDTLAPDFGQTLLELEPAVMKSDVGARVRLSIKLTESYVAGTEAPEATDYTDYSKVTFAAYNDTQKRELKATYQNGQLMVHDLNLGKNDVLSITATSTVDAFVPVSVKLPLGETMPQQLVLNVVGKGGVRATYGNTDSPQVAGMLFNANGKFLKRAVFADKVLTFNALPEGNYTFVAMTRSDILNTAASLAALTEMGLKEKTDYIATPCVVKNGVLTPVEFSNVPTVDESLFAYTSANSSITPNKSSITSGQYLTIRSMVDFKNVYRNRVQNVKLVFAIPEGCSFVDNSLLKGSVKYGYEFADQKVKVDINLQNNDQLRFCVIPTRKGNLEVAAQVEFDLDGTHMVQPLGAAVATVKDFEFNVPNRTGNSEITATGSGPVNSEVMIYQDGNLIGKGTTGQSGNWVVNCQLTDIYSHKDCSLLAKIVTKEGAELVSEPRTVKFDKNAVMIDRVTMLTGTETVVFDFNHRGNTQVYTWENDRLFTFIVKLTDNNPERVKGVRLYVKTLDGGEQPFDCYYSESRDAWLCVGNFTAATAPVNVAVSLYTVDNMVFDRAHFDSYEDKIANEVAAAQAVLDEAKAIRDGIKTDSIASAEKLQLMEQLLTGFDAQTDAEQHAAVNQILTAFGVQPSDIDYSQVDITDEMVKEHEQLLQGLLLPIEYTVTDEDVAKLQEIYEAELNDPTFGADFELYHGQEMSYKDVNGNEYKYSEVKAAEIDLSQYDESQIGKLPMDDGSELTVVNANNLLIIVDTKAGKAWKVQEIPAAGSVSLLSIPREKSDFQPYIEKIQGLYDFLKQNLDLVLSKAEDQLSSIQERLSIAESLEKSAVNDLVKNQTKLRNLDDELKFWESLDMQQGSDYAKKQIKVLEAQRKDLFQNLKRCEQRVEKFQAALNTSKSKFLIGKMAYDKLMSTYQVIEKVGKTLFWGTNAILDHNRWMRFIDSILPCDADKAKAEALYAKATGHEKDIHKQYVQALSIAATTSVASGFCLVVDNVSIVGGPVTKLLIKGLNMIAGIIIDRIFETGGNMYETARETSRTNLNLNIIERNKLKCKKDTEDEFSKPIYDKVGDDPEDNKTFAGNDAEKRVIIDPAGYVYEGVHSNRVEGVKATAYYREEVEDIYGDVHMNVQVWNAEDYAQENPLFTDKNGMYAWDVPPGEWQVKFEKEGYNTSYSEWLPVPPPQLEVNVEITQDAQPEVTEVHAYAEGVDITFNKYMDTESLTTSSIFLTANNEKVEGTIELLNAESKTTDESSKILASKVRFVPTQPLSVTTGKVRLTVNRNVLSYAGIPMTENYTQEIDVEKEVQKIVAEEDILKVLYGAQRTVSISVVPAEAGSGRKLTIENSSPLVASASAQEVVLDENGQAQLTLTGNLPGSSVLTFAMEGSNKTGKADVQVLTEIINAEKPTASRASGSTLYRGTKITLNTESKDAVIYFTTDGSCPCDENGTRRKYTVPIVINADTKILAMTAVGKGDNDVSETVEFNYTLKRSDMDFALNEGWTWISHNFDTPVAAETLATDENVQRIMSQTQEIVRDPQLGLTGMLRELQAAESYKVETSAATARQRLSDLAWNPANPIELNAGWNWLGYPVDQTMSVDEAFAPTQAETHDVIVGQEGFAEYDGEKWVGTLQTLSPGLGYMYQSHSPKQVVYNTAIVSTAAARHTTSISQKSPLVIDVHKYPSVMPMVATLQSADGINLDNENYQINAFCGSECRGIGRVISGRVMMNIYGNMGERITFQITDKDGRKQFANNAALSFSETVVGNLATPYALQINDQTGISDVAYEGNIKVNVDGELLKIKGIAATDINFVEIYDMNGQKLMHETNVSESGIKVSHLDTGVYVVIVNGNGEYTYHKVALR